MSMRLTPSEGRALRAAMLLAAVAVPCGPALAVVGPGPANGDVIADANCRASLPSIGASMGGAGLTKSSAILGGTRSALDAMRSQQQMSPLSVLPRAHAFADSSQIAISLPGVDTSLAPAVPCTAFVASGAGQLPAGMVQGLDRPLGAGNFLASQRIRIKHTLYDADWNRVRSDTLSRSAVKRLVGKYPTVAGDVLAAINGWVNKRIAYAEDRDLFGKADYWAGAKRTLKLGKGDCEDIALVKMQMLAAAGISRDDMFLTVTRDLARNQDHMVLIVKTEAGFRMLDDATDEVLDAAPRNDYRAIVSLGNRGNWLHGA